MVGASDHVGMDKIFGTYRFNGDAELGRAKPADDENLVYDVDDIERLGSSTTLLSSILLMSSTSLMSESK